METEEKIVIPVGVPQQLELTVHNIPLRDCEVEFCIVIPNNISINFPAKLIDDNTFTFTVDNLKQLEEFCDSSLKYNVYVYYGNARFRADNGRFRLVNNNNAVKAKLKESTIKNENTSLKPIVEEPVLEIKHRLIPKEHQDEISKMKELNERRRKNKEIRKALKDYLRKD